MSIGEAYIGHPLRVACRVAKMGGGDLAQAGALLHDAFEDTKLNRTKLKKLGVPRDVLDLVSILTHSPQEDYFLDYLARVVENPIAKLIKIADILDNLSDDPTEKQIEKYAKALLLLRNTGDADDRNFQDYLAMANTKT